MHTVVKNISKLIETSNLDSSMRNTVLEVREVLGELLGSFSKQLNVGSFAPAAGRKSGPRESSRDPFGGAMCTIHVQYSRLYVCTLQ